MSLLKKKYMRCVKGIYIFFLLLSFISCELEDKIGRYTSGDNPVEVELMTRNVTLGGSESGVTLKRLRVIAVAKNSGKVEMNRRADLSEFINSILCPLLLKLYTLSKEGVLCRPTPTLS